MLRLVKFLFKIVKSTFNIVILLCALILAPLFIAAQFLPLLQDYISELAGDFLPHPTVSSIEKKKRMKAESNSKSQRVKNRKLIEENRIHKKANLDLAGQNRRLEIQNSALKEKNILLATNTDGVKKSRIDKANIAVKKVNSVSNRGPKILRRGAAALGVGWVPYAGGAYDLYSLEEDFSDVCDLLHTIDELSGLLFVTSTLYQQGYCDKPEEAMRILKGG